MLSPAFNLLVDKPPQLGKRHLGQRMLLRTMFFIAVCTLSALVLTTSGHPHILTGIPDSLIMCYENATLYDNAMRLQPSIATLLTLIGKLERGGGRNMDIRTFSATILHLYRMDGIQRVPEVPNVPGIIPFTTTGRQFPKYQVVMDQLIPPGSLLPADDTLKDFEKCALHFMLSATVQAWVRGDEHEVCPITVGGRSRSPPKPKPSSWSEWPGTPDNSDPPVQPSAQISRCPIEEGVLWTPWGAVSASALLGGIAAAVNPQRVPITALKRHKQDEVKVDLEPVDNIWGSTLAGDLAEVAVYQGPRAPDSTYLRMGPGGSWNDTAYPRMLYFDPWMGTQGGWEQESWDITEAELRGGIDGLVLGSRLPKWMSKQNSLRLTQLLDMYYSERGVVMETAVRACRRPDLSAEVVVIPTLRQQTDSFASVLYDHVSSVPIAPNVLSQFVDSAVDAYIRFSETVLWRDLEHAPCSENIVANPRVEMLAVLDGTWTTWEGQRVIGVLERYSDISTYGSALAVMNGWTGVAISNFTRLSGYTLKALDDPISWPTGLNLELTIRGARYMLRRRRALESRRGENVSANSRGAVVVVLANTATNDEATLTRAKEEMRICKELMPDVTWLFVTARRREDYIPFVENPARDIISATEGVLESFMPKLILRLREVPGRILPAMCPSMVQDALRGQQESIEWVPVQPKGPHYEDYVTTGEKRLYRVPPTSLLGTPRVKITLRSTNYGDLVVCISRAQPGVDQPPPPFPKTALADEERCENLLANSEVRFTVDEPCSNMKESECRPLFLWLTVQRSDFKCTEEDCRFPDQVRFSMWHEGLQPLPGCGPLNLSPATSTPSAVLLLLLTAAVILRWR